MYLQNNTLQVLPVESLVKAKRLKVLDVRSNLLSSFYPEIVKMIRDYNLDVYFEGKYIIIHYQKKTFFELTEYRFNLISFIYFLKKIFFFSLFYMRYWKRVRSLLILTIYVSQWELSWYEILKIANVACELI